MTIEFHVLYLNFHIDVGYFNVAHISLTDCYIQNLKVMELLCHNITDTRFSHLDKYKFVMLQTYKLFSSKITTYPQLNIFQIAIVSTNCKHYTISHK